MVNARGQPGAGNGELENFRTLNLFLLHLCDSLFPIGAFASSDGLEAATAVREALVLIDRADRGVAGDVVGLREWIDAVLDESIGRLEGPAVWQAWRGVIDRDWAAPAAVRDGLTAIRPGRGPRGASRP